VKWPKEDMFAITIDGKVLMNARALDDVDLAELATRRAPSSASCSARARCAG